ncbi:hypothetical protein QJS04_geneDACA023290 [Acorus gramineus]|uniref:R3H-associated N-terminal domain-containing protein n=1 Tax=Acorus gramineus TaxID=55184 RepID=A0AAV9BSZ8_ACOGR|nr:hypothetical protein QJS04_geneDACA023290 [Acorus gramineus]
MASVEFLTTEGDILSSPIFDSRKGEAAKTRGLLIEKKIEFLESLAGKVSNRRSRRWLNDRLLIELVPRLNAEEIRGLFAPPPWGDNTPQSPFCTTDMGEWDLYRNIDMDKEAHMLGGVNTPSAKRKDHVDNEKVVALNAWHRVHCRTREALRRYFLSDLLQGYERCIQEFIRDSGDGEILDLHVQDPFHRLLLHGVCEFYDLVSVTVTRSEGAKLRKITRIKKKKSGSQQIPPNVTLTGFLKMAKDGAV